MNTIRTFLLGFVLSLAGAALAFAQTPQSSTRPAPTDQPATNSTQGSVAPAATGTGTQGRLAKWTDNVGTLGDSLITETSSGFVGISNPNPSARLSMLAAPQAELRFDQGSGAQTPVISMISNPGNNTVGAAATLGAGTAGVGFVFTDNFPFFILKDTKANVNNNLLGNATPLFTVMPSGNVGVGTTNPQSKLEVAGDIQVAGNAIISGNIAAKYQDVAEWVPARQQLAAGTVVSLDVTHANEVLPSAHAYDTHVAGVVSAQPGLILGEGGAGKVLVATTGRVKVKVDATRAPVKIGDLLVTSDRPGLAMRSRPIKVAGTLLHRPGTIIGKALEPLTGGQGEILVLLSLQ